MGPGLLLLKEHRVQRALLGLEGRLENQFERIDAVQVDHNRNKENLQSEYESSISAHKSHFNQELSNSLTSSDEELNKTWTQFDQATLTSLKDERKNLNQLREWLTTTNNTATADWKRGIETLQSQARNEREKIQTTYEQNKSLLRKYKNDSESVLVKAEEFASHRLIKFEIPKEPIEQPAIQDAEFSFATARHDIEELLAGNQQQLKRLTDRPLARFSESWQIWAVSILCGILAATVTWLTQGSQQHSTRVILTLAVFAGSCIAFGIISMLAIRSIIKKYIKATIPTVANTHQKIIGLIDLTETQLKRTIAIRNQQVDEKLKRDLRESEVATEEKLLKAQRDYDSRKVEIAVGQARKRSDVHSRFETGMVTIRDRSDESSKAVHSSFQLELEKAHTHLKNSIVVQDELERSYNLHARTRIKSGLETLERRLGLISHEMDSFCPQWPKDGSLVKGSDGLNELAYLTVGHIKVDLGSQRQTALNEFNTHPLQSSLPAVFKMIEHGLLLIRCSTKNHTQAQGIIRNILLKAFYSLPAGSLQVTIIDPDGLGREYSNLMQLADTDPTLVNHRVWTQNVHISEQLAKLSHHTEDVIQQLLRDRYQDIRQYNREAGTMSEPYRLVVWSRFPAGVDEASWRYLSSLVSSGGRCGVSTILLVDEDMPLPPMVDLKRFDGTGLHITLNGQSASKNTVGVIQEPTLKRFPVAFEEPADATVQREILRRVAEESLKANRVEVPFESMIPPTTPTYQSRSASGLVIPVGQAGVGRSQTLRLGHGTAQHVLVAGKTGSGKSSFLHTLVTSAAYHYSPNELRLVLLDFKKGVEFQVYSETELSHADIIGIESQREFGLSAFEYLDRIMQKRGEAFRHSGVQDVPSWCKAHPAQPMPRVLVVVDEFQEIFTEDDKLAQQAAMYLDRIVRQGRSFGIHVVLASQTLGGAYSLPRTTLAQMAVRVALQCEGADAMMILSEDNLAAERLRHSGQAIYNDQSGRLEGNQPFQVSYLHKNTQMEFLSSLAPMPRLQEPMHGGLEKPVVFDGHRKAIWDSKVIDIYLDSLRSEFGSAPLLLLGDSVSIEPAQAIPLYRQAAQNVLLVGQDDENIAAVFNSMTSAFLHNGDAEVPVNRHITVLDSSRDEDVHVQNFLKHLQNRSSSAERVQANKIDDAIIKLHELMKERMRTLEDDTGTEGKVEFVPELLVLPHLGRARSLRRNEEFSFDDDGQAKIDKLFQEVLRDGPSVAIHSCIGCDNANTVNRWLSRQTIHDFEYRVLMQMSVSDSNHLIDSAAANRLDKNVLLLYSESSGLVRKFRPYSFNYG